MNRKQKTCLWLGVIPSVAINVFWLWRSLATDFGQSNLYLSILITFFLQLTIVSITLSLILTFADKKGPSAQGGQTSLEYARGLEKALTTVLTTALQRSDIHTDIDLSRDPQDKPADGEQAVAAVNDVISPSS